MIASLPCFYVMSCTRDTLISHKKKEGGGACAVFCFMYFYPVVISTELCWRTLIWGEIVGNFIGGCTHTQTDIFCTACTAFSTCRLSRHQER